MSFLPAHPFADLIGLRFTQCAAGESECRVTAEERLHNPQQALHGAVLYAMADTGMGGALYTQLGPNELCATSQISISYFAPVKAGEIVCRTRVLHKGKRTASLESDITQDGKALARALGTFAVFERK